MNMIDKEPERHEIEALPPWHAAGTLSRRDADLIEGALARDSEKLFAAIDAEEAGSARRRRRRISRTPSRATASILNSNAPAATAREQRLSK
jgi:hypothetical protein